MDNSKYYVSTPIFYTNGKPHIGHVYSTIAADIIARFMKSFGKEVLFTTGTDEHGGKVEESAKKLNVPTQDFVDQISTCFHDALNAFNLSEHTFVRTSSSHHKKAVQHIWNQLVRAGDIYLGKYSGWYSVRDETFFLDKDLVDGKAPTGADVEYLEEECYFFKLSKYQDKLLKYYDDHPDFVLPKGRFNEVKSFVSSGLKDLAVSRKNVKWGIPVPGNDEHVIYVWLDALSNYITSIGYPQLDRQIWPCDLHIVGKDILTFHAVYWPAFLMALNLELPKTIFAHGWWLNQGEKMSKSLGNTIDPMEEIQKFNIDYIRYFLFREISFGQDGSYSEQAIKMRVNTELVGKIGNLVNRVLVFVDKHYDMRVPTINMDITDLYKEKLLQKVNLVPNRIEKHLKHYKLLSILETILETCDSVNVYINKHEIWKLTDTKKRDRIIYELLETIRYIGICLAPFIPESASQILDLLSIPTMERNMNCLNKNHAIKLNTLLKKPHIIFKKLL